MDSSPETAKGTWFTDHLGGLREEQCKFTSKATGDYNCVGFVVGDYLWWQPTGRRGHHWPESLRLPRLRRNGIPPAKAYVTALKTVGFEVCPIQNAEPEEGFEKAAVYQGVDGTFTHVAMICGKEVWKSKLGNYEDIEHPPPPQRVFGSFGTVYKYLRREIRDGGKPIPEEYRI